MSDTRIAAYSAAIPALMAFFQMLVAATVLGLSLWFRKIFFPVVVLVGMAGLEFSTSRGQTVWRRRDICLFLTTVGFLAQEFFSSAERIERAFPH